MAWREGPLRGGTLSYSHQRLGSRHHPSACDEQATCIVCVCVVCRGVVYYMYMCACDYESTCIMYTCVMYKRFINLHPCKRSGFPLGMAWELWRGKERQQSQVAA